MMATTGIVNFLFTHHSCEMLGNALVTVRRRREREKEGGRERERQRKETIKTMQTKYNCVIVGITKVSAKKLLCSL